MTNSSNSKCCEECGLKTKRFCIDKDCPCHKEKISTSKCDCEVREDFVDTSYCPIHAGDPRQSPTTHNQEESIVITGADFTQKQRDAINLLVTQAIQEERERLAGLIEQKKRVNVVGSVAMYCLEGEGKAINDVLDEIIGQIPAK